jgi:ADP-ribosylglycohydrolase
MHALAGTEAFCIERVAQAYLWWLQTEPFDIGFATEAGLSGGLTCLNGGVHDGMLRAAADRNEGSKANGSLMRIAPLGVWGYRLSEDALVEAACWDSKLTHPNPTCQHVCATYCVAIRHLCLHPHDALGAIDSALERSSWLANDEVASWLNDALSEVDPGYHPHSGFVRYGFTHAFRHLKLQSTYETAVQETLLGGGDTDTNAFIVGGLIGALHGSGGIPAEMVKSILTCDTGRGRPRPKRLQTREQLPRLIHKLVE